MFVIFFLSHNDVDGLMMKFSFGIRFCRAYFMTERIDCAMFTSNLNIFNIQWLKMRYRTREIDLSFRNI